VGNERTFVGLDVHARSVTGHALDAVTGEVWQRKLCPDPGEVLRWVSGLPGPVKVGYEAGPTGYGLYRCLNDHGVLCVVAAPSKLHRPHGDRVKTDARDAELLAHLLKLGEIVEVNVPSVEQEAARDLVRAREDARADLMRARHRVSKMLLRQGIVYSGGDAWTKIHDHWLRGQRFDQQSQQLAYDSAYEAMVLTVDRRDRLDRAIDEMAANSSYTPVVRRLGCLRGISTLTGFALAVEIGDWQRFTGATIGAFVGLVPPSPPPASPAPRARSPRPATPTPAGCWSRRPGTTPSLTGCPAKPCGIGGNSPRRRPGSAATKATLDCTNAGRGSTPARSVPRSPTSPSPASLPAGPGRSPYSNSKRRRRLLHLRRRQPGCRARNDPRSNYEQP
jgi:transposase